MFNCARRSILGRRYIKSGDSIVTYNVFSPKLLPKTSVAAIKSGIEIQSEIISTERCVMEEMTIENPVIPPGARCECVKKKFTVIAAKAEESVSQK